MEQGRPVRESQAEVAEMMLPNMEVGVKVFAENLKTGERRHTSSAFVTFVAIDKDGRPYPIPPVIPETEGEKRRYEQAEQRRQYRLEHRARQR